MENQDTRNLQKLEKISIKSINSKEILTTSICTACLRFGEKGEFPIQQLYDDLNEEFNEIDVKIIVKAIKNGSTGKFGDVYRLNIPTIMIWIRTQIKIEIDENRNKGYSLEEQRKLFGS